MYFQDNLSIQVYLEFLLKLWITIIHQKFLQVQSEKFRAGNLMCETLHWSNLETDFLIVLLLRKRSTVKMSSNLGNFTSKENFSMAYHETQLLIFMKESKVWRQRIQTKKILKISQIFKTNFTKPQLSVEWLKVKKQKSNLRSQKWMSKINLWTLISFLIFPNLLLYSFLVS